MSEHENEQVEEKESGQEDLEVPEEVAEEVSGGAPGDLKFGADKWGTSSPSMKQK